jgi:ABC-type uncharacterized transport system permease subunit
MIRKRQQDIAGTSSVFQITILFLYLMAGTAFALNRLPRLAHSAGMLLWMAFLLSITGLIWHFFVLATAILGAGGLSLTLGNAASFIGLQLALIAILGAIEPTLRGLSGGLLYLSAAAAMLTTTQQADAPAALLSWQLQAHVLIALFAYGLLSVGAIVALYALIQDSRLRAGRLTSINHLFAPLETNEKLLYGIAASGFVILLIAVFSGMTFVDNLFAQHLVHKSAFSILALVLFGILLAGRHFAGWRGRRAVYLYLWGFLMLGLAYFGSRFVLESVLGRSWG